MPYLYETHCHSSQCSRCAHSTAQEQVRAYHAAGYAGLVLTDHFIFGNTAVDRSLPWPERMRAYYDAYLQAVEAARGLDFDVLFGLEHHYGHGKEVLVYGIDLDFLLDNPDIPDISIDDFARRVRDYGGIVVHAHPFRARSYVNMAFPPRLDLVDGIEIYNACNAPGEDRQALAAAQGGTFIRTSGGDIHESFDERVGSAGILLPHRVRTGRELVQALKAGNFHLRVEGRDLAQVTVEDLP